MSKGKLAKFADMERFENVFQYPYSVVDDVPFDMKGKWREMYFHNDNPIVLELGCGKGEYTVELAKLYPEMNFIGVDIKGARMWTGAKKAIDMGGGIGIPPMLELARELPASVEKQIIVGYRDDQLFLKEDLEKNGTVYIATEDGSVGTKGNVMNAIEENHLQAGVIFACGPMPMLRAIKKYAEEKKIKAYISLEEHMACGVGACLGCVVKTKEVDHHSHVHNARICTDGPVFDAEEVEI